MVLDLALTTEVAQVVSASRDVESLARPLLEILHRLTGLDATYLTEIRADANEQEILYAQNWREPPIIPEGLVVEYSDSLCKRALASNTPITTNVPEVWGDSEAAKALGLQTYVSVPVCDEQDVVVGTLCGVSDVVKEQSSDILGIMQLFARLIADQWQRDSALQDANDRAREAEQRLADRATQLAENEHKLKSPLTVIKGWATLLDEDFDTMSRQTQGEAIARIKGAADKLASQLDEMIEAQRRIATTAIQLEVDQVYLVQLLNQVRYELAGMSKKHTLIVDAPEELAIDSNESTLWHMLSHLGENAVKYSPNGATVTLGAHRSDNHVIISVADTGPGLPQDVDVFQPFVRGDRETTSGSGLGLHIVQTLARSLKATLSVHSEAGEGTTFYVTLPNVLKAKE